MEEPEVGDVVYVYRTYQSKPIDDDEVYLAVTGDREELDPNEYGNDDGKLVVFEAVLKRKLVARRRPSTITLSAASKGR